MSRFYRWLRAAQMDESFAKLTVATIPFVSLILVMDFSKEKWKISAPNGFFAWASVFHAELLIVPLIFLLPFFLGRLRKGYLILLTLIYSVFLLDFIAWFTIDRPVQPFDLVRGTEMVHEYSEFVGQLGERLLFKLFVFALAPAFIWVVVRWVERRKLTEKLNGRTTQLLIGCSVVYAAAFPLVYRPGYFNHNSIVRIVEEMAYEAEVASLKTDTATIQRMFGIAPEVTPRHFFEGGPTHRNVVVFIIETAPQPYYPSLLDYLTQHGDADLASSAIQSYEHYTTYPQSERSIYSILTGRYPPQPHRWVRQADYAHSLVHVLNTHGYSSFMVSTGPLEFHDDVALYHGLGFQHLEQVSDVKKAFQFKNGELVWDRSKLYGADLQLLSFAKQIIGDHARSGSRPFLLTLAPQASHAPYEVPPGSSASPQDHVALLRANAIWQFGLVHEVIAALRQNGELANTTIVVTGDHGLRSVYESNQIFHDPTVLNEISFRVPIWFLNTGRENVSNPAWATSHIDVTPTLLDLLGIDYRAVDYHGQSMLRERPQRAVFFLGGEYLSPNGFKFGHRFYMENRRRQTEFVQESFDFSVAERDAKQTGPKPFPGPLSRKDVHQMLAYLQSFLAHE